MANFVEKITSQFGNEEAWHSPLNCIEQPLPDHFVERWTKLMPPESFENITLYDFSSEMISFLVTSPEYIADVCLKVYDADGHVDPREGWRTWQKTGVVALRVYQRKKLDSN